MNGQAVIFSINGQNYALPIMQIQEIIKVVKITPLPGTEYNVEGIINLRGNVLPVLNLSKTMGLAAKEYDAHTRIIVVESEAKRIGLIVDQVNEVGRYDSTEVELADVVGDEVGYISGVVKRDDRLWLMLDLDRIVEVN